MTAAALADEALAVMHQHRRRLNLNSVATPKSASGAGTGGVGTAAPRADADDDRFRITVNAPGHLQARSCAAKAGQALLVSSELAVKSEAVKEKALPLDEELRANLLGVDRSASGAHNAGESGALPVSASAFPRA